MSTQTFALANLGSIFDSPAPPPTAASAPSSPAAPAAPSSLNTLEQALSGLSSLASPWFTAITGQTVVPLPTSAAQAALQQTQIQQQAQAKLLQTAPNAAGLLANPTAVLFGIGIFGLLFYLISQSHK